jgi:hypothetical protein
MFAMSRNVCLAAVAALVLAGCNNSTIFRQASFGSTKVLSLDAKQRLVLQRETTYGTVTCTEPSPDAITAHAAQLAARAQAQLDQGQSGSAGLAISQSEAVASIALRTQTIQLLRDGYFRLCEAYMNGVLEPQRYQAIISFIDEFITTVAAIEAIGGIVQAPPAQIFAGGSATAGADSAGTTGTGSPAPTITITNTKSLTKDQTDALKVILDRYYARKHQYLVMTHTAGN